MNANLNALDWLLIALLAYSVVRAFLRGILIESLTLGGLIAAIYLAAWNYHSLAAIIERVTSNFSHVPAVVWSIVAYLTIALGVMLLVGLVAKALRQGAHAVGLGFFDRLLGAAFGLARGWLLGVAFLLPVAAFLPQSSLISNSRLTPYFLAGVHAVSFGVPSDLQQRILNGIEQIKHTAPDWIKLPR
jgi:membrane protein required for colicin V production